MEDQIEKEMEHEMETGVIWGLYRDPSVQTHYLHWALESAHITYLGPLGVQATSKKAFTSRLLLSCLGETLSNLVPATAMVP